jgi:capsular exopolysaccharide synthesis family protein
MTDPQNRNLPALPFNSYGMNHYAPPPPQLQEPEPEEPTVPFSHYLWILSRQRWKILTFVLTCMVATFVVAKRLTPIYESTATIDVDRQTPAGIIGQDSVRMASNDADQYLATQVDLIKSDSVLRPVVEKFRLREVEKDQLEDDSKAAGRSSADREDAPVSLKRLEVVRPPNTYLLRIVFRSTSPRLAADVANGIANSYLEHNYNIRFQSTSGVSHFMEKQMEDLRAKMERSSAALAQFEKELNVIDPEQKTSILSGRLVQLNTEYTSAQAERVRKEAAFNSMKSGSMDAAMISSQGEALKRLTEQSNEARQRFNEAQNHYGPGHPEYKKAASQVEELSRQLEETRKSIQLRIQIEYTQAVEREAMLKTAVNQTKAEFDNLNARSFNYQALKEEADSDKKLYDELFRKIKEAGINAGFQNSSVRLADAARPALKPVFPNIPVFLLVAFSVSSFLAIAAAVISDSLDKTIRDPEQVARILKTEVIGTLPAMKTWRNRLNPVSSVSLDLARIDAGASDHHLSSYEEAIRTLRNSILLSDFDRRLRSVLITSASPSEGKTTVAAHLAAAHAEQHHKTLLIDCDLRRPSLHRLFQLALGAGLSTVLTHSLPWEQAVVHSADRPELDVLPAGPPSRRAADLLGKNLPQILEDAASRYDLIILDAPPLLGFPEPLQMAANVDGVVIVTRAGQTNRKAVSSVLATLARLRANVIGMVLNDVKRDSGEGYYYYNYYGSYSYRAAKEETTSPS